MMTKKNNSGYRLLYKISASVVYSLWFSLYLFPIRPAIAANINYSNACYEKDSTAHGLPSGLLTTPKIYSAPRVDRPVAIDGHLQESAWQKAPWSELFTDIAGCSKIKGVRIDEPSEILPTRVKMCWDDDFLYIAARLKEPDLWATLRSRDTIIYHNNDFEFFFTTGSGISSYYELEINALGTILDLFMPRPYRNGGKAIVHWDLKGLQSAVHLNGSLNDPSDTDRYWTVELAIPFEGVLSYGQRKPESGSYWRVNFSRVQWDLIRNDKTYQRKTSQGRLLPEHNWVWSPQGMINMHAPDRWGYLFFSADSTTVYELPLVEKLQALLWKIYYLQKFTFARHKKYALTLRELGVSNHEISWADPKTGKAVKATLQMAAGQDWFRVALIGENGKQRVALDQHGLISVTGYR